MWSLLAAAFCVPVTTDFVTYDMAWSALDKAPVLALLGPAMAAVLGLIAALAGGLPVWARAALLVVAGAAGLLGLPAQGRFAGTPHTMPPLFLLGLVITGSSLILRLVGKIMPLAVPLSSVINRDLLVFWSCVYLLLPVLLVPVAVLVAWPRPRGLWDQRSMLVRAPAWLVVLYLPLGCALYLFNMIGWGHGISGVVLEDRFAADGGYLVASNKEFTLACMVGRMRLAMLATAFALWLELGLVVLFTHLRPSRQVPTARIMGRR